MEEHSFFLLEFLVLMSVSIYYMLRMTLQFVQL